MTTARLGVTAFALTASFALARLTSSHIVAQEPDPFVDVTAQSGVSFVHANGAAGELLLPEVIGAGGALLDYDNDGDLDILAVQSGTLRGAASPAQPTRLYRNDLNTDRALRFTDVTAASGLAPAGYGMGAATGDFNNDGWTDLYITALNGNRLYQNNGDGSFGDVTGTAGTADQGWSTGATFVDYDRDGWLDLFVVHYVEFDLAMKLSCFAADSAPDYCNPAVYAPAPDRLFHNNRNGTFTDVSRRAGLSRAPARGLGVLAADFNEDGWLDLYVANDGDPNQLWINQKGSGAFTDEALLSGVAVNRMGRPQGSMGVDAADIDGDGDEDLFVTNLDNEGNTLYRNLGRMLYEDRTLESGLFRLGFTGFGTRAIDYDNDGWPDLVVANGAVRRSRQQMQQGEAFPLRQRNQLFHNDRGRRFVDVTGGAGAAFARSAVGRGVAAGDLDNDGDSDLVMFDNSGPMRVLSNNVGQRRHWLGVRVMDGRRDALQARVVLERSRSAAVVRRVQVDGSYCAASDPRIVFGLGHDAAPPTVRVYWPGGEVQEFRGLAIDRYWLLEPGKPARAAVS